MLYILYIYVIYIYWLTGHGLRCRWICAKMASWQRRRGMAVGRRMAVSRSGGKRKTVGWSIGLPVMVYDNPQSIYIYIYICI